MNKLIAIITMTLAFAGITFADTIAPNHAMVFGFACAWFFVISGCYLIDCYQNRHYLNKKRSWKV